MGNNYVVVYKENGKREFSLETLFYGIHVGSSIFEIVEGKEILLGVISHKALVYIAVEFVDYASKEYFPAYDTKNTRYISEVARRWVDDPSSVSDKELSVTSNPYIRDNHRHLYLINTILSPNNYFYYLCKEIEENCGNKKEALRQGQFIVDFLKSGKHLFMV